MVSELEGAHCHIFKAQGHVIYPSAHCSSVTCLFSVASVSLSAISTSESLGGLDIALHNMLSASMDVLPQISKSDITPPNVSYITCRIIHFTHTCMLVGIQLYVFIHTCTCTNTFTTVHIHE